MPKSISEHVGEILSQMEKVQKLSKEQRIQFGHHLYEILRARQRDDYILDPLIPKTDRLTPIVADYLKDLKPTDVMDDPPSPFAFKRNP
jgi:hypothetical protein